MIERLAEVNGAVKLGHRAVCGLVGMVGILSGPQRRCICLLPRSCLRRRVESERIKITCTQTADTTGRYEF